MATELSGGERGELLTTCWYFENQNVADTTHATASTDSREPATEGEGKIVPHAFARKQRGRQEMKKSRKKVKEKETRTVVDDKEGQCAKNDNVVVSSSSS